MGAYALQGANAVLGNFCIEVVGIMRVFEACCLS